MINFTNPKLNCPPFFKGAGGCPNSKTQHSKLKTSKMHLSHIPKIMELFQEDERLQPTHISLYFALYQAWSQNRFENPFPVDLKKLMKSAKIKSLSIYINCFQDLKNWKYLEHNSNYAPYLATKVNLFTFCHAECDNCKRKCLDA
jgi:hypothetical protein